MNKRHLIRGIGAALLGLAATALQASSGTDPRDFGAFYAPYYRLPDPTAMSPAAARGKELVHATYRYLGAESGIAAANGRPYVGNKLACSNCHIDDGTRPNAGPLVVVARKYAAPGIYSPREGVRRDLTIRINGCFERSLAGEALPADSPWMQDLKAYMEFLAGGIQSGFTWQQVPGQEFPKVDLLTRAADPARGAVIYKDQCESCHQRDGAGVWRDDEERYRYPAVWGPGSFGLMAGMGRLATAVTLVWGNMPYDKVNALDPRTRLPQEDAWDVTAYLLSKTRPFDSRFLNDWSGNDASGMPNRLRRNADASYDWTMPRLDGQGYPSIEPTDAARFTRQQHTYGPFQPINDAMTETRHWLGYP